MFEPLAEVRLEFHPEHQRVGPAPDEVVFRFTVSAGRVEGPRLDLTVVPCGGSEWGTIRGDGMFGLDMRHMLRTGDGELVYATFSGLYDLGDDGYLDALEDRLSSKARADLMVRFYTAAGEYRWLNREQFVGSGERDFASRTLALRIFSLGPANG